MDGNVVQAAQLATLALKVVNDQGVLWEFYVLGMLSA